VQYDVIVEASGRVAATSKRTEKVALLAAVLAAAPPSLVPVVVGFLTGEPRQGRFGVGWATLRGARVAPADTSSVAVEEIDTAVTALAAEGGGGSQAAREQRLAALLGRLTEAEQQHIVRLLGG